MSEYILEMNSISKTFPGVKALDKVSFKVKKGEIHCLVGENGAGKSTLMKVLSGVYPYGDYDGDIILDGQIQKYTGINDSEKAGIAIIYQELALVPELTIYEILFLGHEIKKGRLIDWNETIVKSKDLLNKVKLNVDPSSKVKEHGVGKRQLIEIAKALSKEVRLLILDEPTAALNEDDSENLLILLKELKAQGVTCIMISHKLKEVIAIADTVTVLRDGQTICSKSNENEPIDEPYIIKNMVGREIDNIYPKRDNHNIGDVIFEVKNWNAFDYTKGRDILKNIDFNVKKGEVVGLAGLMGAGRTEFAHSVFGNISNYKLSGEIDFMGETKHFKNPADAIKAGIAYVSEDRKGDGLIMIDDIKQNITLANLKKLSPNGLINENEEVKIATWYKDSMNIKSPSIEQLVGNLSGGNQQKVSFAKWLFVSPKLLILDEPTRGIDVGAKFEIYTLINDLISKGLSIIMISSELSEILGMCDRIYVMAEGEIKGVLDSNQANQENIMRMATN